MSSVVRNFGVTKKLFASTSVLAEKQDPADPQKPLDSTKKIKSEWSRNMHREQCFDRLFLDPTIAAVFATLNDVDESTPEVKSAGSKQMNIDDIIMNAKTVNGLLAIAETQQDISRKHALKVARGEKLFAYKLLN